MKTATILTLTLVAMFSLTCGMVALSDNTNATPIDDNWKGVNYSYQWHYENGTTAISMNSTYKIPLGTDFSIASWDKDNQRFDMGNGQFYTIPDSIWTYGPPYYDTLIEKPVTKPTDNMTLKGWATNMMDLTVVYLPGETVTAENAQNLILYSVFETVNPELIPESIPEPKPYVKPNITLKQNIIETVTLNYFAGNDLVHVANIDKGTKALEPMLPVGFAAWDFDFDTFVQENTEVYAIPSSKENTEGADTSNGFLWWILLILIPIVIWVYYNYKKEERSNV